MSQKEHDPTGVKHIKNGIITVMGILFFIAFLMVIFN